MRLGSGHRKLPWECKDGAKEMRQRGQEGQDSGAESSESSR
jgi:hypothetical protein